SPTIGAVTPCWSRRSLMCGTAAAASSRSTVMRTSSEPARASAATCATVAATSAVSVLVIDCTTTGAPPPTATPPTLTATDLRRSCGAASMFASPSGPRPASVALSRQRGWPCPGRSAARSAGISAFTRVFDALWRTAVRCRPGTAQSSVLVAIPDQRCTAPRQAALRAASHPGHIGSPHCAMGANPADLDHRRFRGEAGAARRGAQRGGDLRRGGFADRAAALANQKHHEVAGGMRVHAGDEGVAALDAVHETVGAQEFEGAIDGDRRRPRAARRDPVHDLVGAERVVACQQRAEHVAADVGEPLAALHAARLGDGHGVAQAALMVVAGRVGDRGPDALFSCGDLGSGHAGVYLLAAPVSQRCGADSCYCTATCARTPCSCEGSAASQQAPLQRFLCRRGRSPSAKRRRKTWL